MRTIRLIVTCAVCGSVWLMGCKKKVEAPAPTETTAAPATPAAPGAQPAANRPAATPVSYSEAQAALNAKNYERAADLMIQLRTPPPSQVMTPEQAMAYANQMRALQQNLSSAVAAGDPKAIAAAQRLRQASMTR